MAKFLRLVNGAARSFDEGASVTIYDQPLTVVPSGAGANQINGPVITGTAVTLPVGGTYSGAELEIRLNGQRLEQLYDYNYVGAGTRTQVSFTFDLAIGDRVDFRVDRAA
jgi:hypothetical protein